jgi:mannose-6-phosphate isomerase-like protein (cupin superfamily)
LGSIKDNLNEWRKERLAMIVRNLQDKEVLDTTYVAHGGAIAQMILDRRVLNEIGFLAIARLGPGRAIESHVDPMEEIYFITSGSGEMAVNGDRRQVGPGDAVWIPAGSAHGLRNNGKEECVILVVASPQW